MFLCLDAGTVDQWPALVRNRGIDWPEPLSRSPLPLILNCSGTNVSLDRRLLLHSAHTPALPSILFIPPLARSLCSTCPPVQSDMQRRSPSFPNAVSKENSCQRTTFCGGREGEKESWLDGGLAGWGQHGGQSTTRHREPTRRRNLHYLTLPSIPQASAARCWTLAPTS